MISPRPSTFDGRASSRATCGCGSRSSAASSTVTIRSAGSMNPAIALRSVVLPVPVPPEMTMFSRPRTLRSSNAACAGRMLPASTSRGTDSTVRENLRMVSSGPSTASGGSTALTRLPSGRRASTIGLDSSTRRPTAADDAVDHVPQVRLVLEPDVLLAEHARALTEHLVRAVDDHLGDRRVVHERLQRAQPRRLVGDRRHQPVELARRERQAVGPDQVERGRLHRAAQIAGLPGRSSRLSRTRSR